MLISVKWTGMPGVRVEPSSLTQECFTAVGSKKIAADVSDASISCEAMDNIMVIYDAARRRVN